MGYTNEKCPIAFIYAKTVPILNNNKKITRKIVYYYDIILLSILNCKLCISILVVLYCRISFMGCSLRYDVLHINTHLMMCPYDQTFYY